MNEEQLRAELAAVYASTSWRMTAPLRLTMTMVYSVRAFVRNPRPLVGNVLRRAGQVEALRKTGGGALRSFPTLHERVKRIVYPNSYVPVAPLIATTFENTRPPAEHHEPELIAIVCDAVVPANDAVLAAPSIAPALPDAHENLGAGARAVLAQLQGAQWRFRRSP